MADDKVASVLGMTSEERYDYFLSIVGEEKEVWILVNGDKQFLKIYAEEEKFEYLPVWPDADFAIEYAKGSEGLSPKNISLPELFKKWVPGLQKDGLEIGVLPGLDSEVWITSASELQSDLQDELSAF